MLLLSYREISFCYLGCLSEKHPHNDCPGHFSSIPMDGTALPGRSQDFTEFWVAAHDNTALMPASLGLSATLKPRIPDTLNMGNGLNSLPSFCVDPLRSAGKLPLHPKALELAHIVRFQKVSNSGQEIDREDNAICLKQKFFIQKLLFKCHLSCQECPVLWQYLAE